MIGTRPEAIKLAPVVKEFQVDPRYETIVVSTGQHKELVNDTLRIFGVETNYNLDVMSSRQSLESLTVLLFSRVSELLESSKPDLVFGQGDTTSVFVTSTVCFYKKIPFAHIEAGLRSHNINSPFPEEFNRRVAGLVSLLHFAPSLESAKHLMEENVPSEKIHIVGNTVIDALKIISDKNLPFDRELPKGKKIILLTAHRRENFGLPHLEIFKAVKELIFRYPELYFVYPVHPNPMVREAAHSFFAGEKSILLTGPLDYHQLISLLKMSLFVMTDSGGIQEEAPFLGKPVLILREETERMEVVDEKLAILVGTKASNIVASASRLIEDSNYFNSYVQYRSPYGDGFASLKIKDIIDKFVSIE